MLFVLFLFDVVDDDVVVVWYGCSMMLTGIRCSAYDCLFDVVHCCCWFGALYRYSFCYRYLRSGVTCSFDDSICCVVFVLLRCSVFYSLLLLPDCYLRYRYRWFCFCVLFAVVVVTILMHSIVTVACWCCPYPFVTCFPLRCILLLPFVDVRVFYRFVCCSIVVVVRYLPFYSLLLFLLLPLRCCCAFWLRFGDAFLLRCRITFAVTCYGLLLLPITWYSRLLNVVVYAFLFIVVSVARWCVAVLMPRYDDCVVAVAILLSVVIVIPCHVLLLFVTHFFLRCCCALPLYGCVRVSTVRCWCWFVRFVVVAFTFTGWCCSVTLFALRAFILLFDDAVLLFVVVPLHSCCCYFIVYVVCVARSVLLRLFILIIVVIGTLPFTRCCLFCSVYSLFVWYHRLFVCCCCCISLFIVVVVVVTLLLLLVWFPGPILLFVTNSVVRTVHRCRCLFCCCSWCSTFLFIVVALLLLLVFSVVALLFVICWLRFTILLLLLLLLITVFVILGLLLLLCTVCCCSLFDAIVHYYVLFFVTLLLVPAFYCCWPLFVMLLFHLMFHCCVVLGTCCVAFPVLLPLPAAFDRCWLLLYAFWCWLIRLCFVLHLRLLLRCLFVFDDATRWWWCFALPVYCIAFGARLLLFWYSVCLLFDLVFVVPIAIYSLFCLFRFHSFCDIVDRWFVLFVHVLAFCVVVRLHCSSVLLRYHCCLFRYVVCDYHPVGCCALLRFSSFRFPAFVGLAMRWCRYRSCIADLPFVWCIWWLLVFCRLLRCFIVFTVLCLWLFLPLVRLRFCCCSFWWCLPFLIPMFGALLTVVTDVRLFDDSVSRCSLFTVVVGMFDVLLPVHFIDDYPYCCVRTRYSTCSAVGVLHCSAVLLHSMLFVLLFYCLLF